MKPNENPDNPQAPARLVRALKELRAGQVFVPPTMDEAILGHARRQFVPETSRDASRWWRSWLPKIAVTASICVVVLVGWLATSRPSGGVASIPEDVNHDGVVDIRDAFQLAREVESGSTPAGARDMNGDGKVDQADVALIARRAVHLESGGTL